MSDASQTHTQADLVRREVERLRATIKPAKTAEAIADELSAKEAILAAKVSEAEKFIAGHAAQIPKDPDGYAGPFQPPPEAQPAVCYEATPVRVPYDPAKLSRENGPLRIPRVALLAFLSGDLGPATIGEMRRAHRRWKRSDVRNMLVNGDERGDLFELERAFERFIGLPREVHGAEQDHQLQDDSHLLRHARAELTKAGLFDPDSDYDGEIGPAVLEIVTQLGRQGHSGHSAALLGSLLQRLWAFKPLRPLTGADDEWNEVRRGEPDEQGRLGTLQNLRCCSVFQDSYADGTLKTHDIDGGVKIHPDGFRSSHPIPVTFPYMPADKPKEFWCDADGNVLPDNKPVAVDALPEQAKQANPVSGLLSFQQARQWLLDTRDALNRLHNGEHARSYGKEYEPVICHVGALRQPVGLLSSHVDTLRLIDVYPDGSMLSYAKPDQAVLDGWEQSSPRWVTTYLGCVIEAVKHADEIGVLLHKSFKTPSVDTMEAVRLLSLCVPSPALPVAVEPEQQASHPVWSTRAVEAQPKADAKKVHSAAEEALFEARRAHHGLRNPAAVQEQPKAESLLEPFRTVRRDNTDPARELLTFEAARKRLLETRDALTFDGMNEHGRSYGKRWETVICHLEHLVNPVGLLDSHRDYLRIIDVQPDGRVTGYQQATGHSMAEFEHWSPRWVETTLGAVCEAFKHADKSEYIVTGSDAPPTSEQMGALRLLTLRNSEVGRPGWKPPQDPEQPNPEQVVHTESYHSGLTEGRAKALSDVGAAMHAAGLGDTVDSLTQKDLRPYLWHSDTQAIAKGHDDPSARKRPILDRYRKGSGN